MGKKPTNLQDVSAQAPLSDKQFLDEALIRATSIDPNNLDGELISLPAYYARFSEQLYEASRKAGLAKADLEHTEARVFLNIKSQQTFSHSEGKAPAVSLVEKHVADSREVIDAKIKLVETEATYERLRNILRALDHKAQMLITIGANRRQEATYAGGLTLNKVTSKQEPVPTRYQPPTPKVAPSMEWALEADPQEEEEERQQRAPKAQARPSEEEPIQPRGWVLE